MATVGWIADAGRPTGFSRVTHALGERLVRTFGHDVHVLAVGWNAADPIDTPLKLYRAEAGPANHYLGFDRVVPWLMKVQPDVVVIHEDPSIMVRRIIGNPYDSRQVLKRYRPIIGYVPVDGYNMPSDMLGLNRQCNVVAFTKFGQRAYPGSRLVYHGVDPTVFHEVSADEPIRLSSGQTVTTKAECREAFQIPEDAFVVGRIDTNSGRKDWGRQWAVMDDYFHTPGLPEAVAFWHTKKTNPGHGMDLDALVSRSHGSGRFYITDRSDWPIEDVVGLMNAFDVVLTTSRGEAFSLPTAEAMACGIPVIAPDHSAFPEVVGPGGILVPPDGIWTNPYGVDLMTADVKGMSAALANLALDRDLRLELGQRAKRHVVENFNWDVSAEQFHTFIEAFVGAAADAIRLEQRPALGGEG